MSDGSRDPHEIWDEAALRALEEDAPVPPGVGSGAAAAVAHGSCLPSIGTDTGGSLRLPAAWTGTQALAWTGTVGFKPPAATGDRKSVV